MTGKDVSDGNGTTWLTITPAPWLPSSCANESEPTKEIATNTGFHLDLVRELDEFGDRLVRPDRDHGFGIALHDVEQRGFHRRGVALETAFGDERHIAFRIARCTPSRPARPKASS